ncbi:MAG: tetratricopeptide repeat protein, partial [Bacteroidota bacterium]
MRKLQLFLTFILFQGFVIHISAQDYASQFEKIQEDYTFGDYDKALKQIEKIKEKSIKSFGKDNRFNAQAILEEAKCFVALGYLEDGLNQLDKAITMSSRIHGETSIDHGFTLRDASQVYLLYGHYRKASTYTDQAEEIFKNNSALNEDVKAEFQVNRANILVGKGFYAEAIRTIDGQLPFFQQRLNEGDKKTLERNAQEYAQLLIYRANALRLMGDYLRADSAFVSNELWIDEALGKKDLTYSKNQFYNALLLEESGMDVDPLTKFYEKAYLKVLKDYAPSHYMVMDLRNKLLSAYFRNSNKAKYKITNEELRMTLNKYHDERSFYSMSDELVKFDNRVEEQDLDGLSSDLSAVLRRKSTLPTNHYRRIELLEIGYRVAILSNKLQNAQNYLNAILNIQKELVGEDAPAYHLTQVRLANYYIDHTDNFDIAKKIYDESWVQIVEPEITEGHPEYTDILNHVAKFYSENDDFEKASRYLDKALLEARRKWDNKDIRYARELHLIAGLQLKIGNYDKARSYLDEAFEIVLQTKTLESLTDYSAMLITDASLLSIYGEYDEAESNIDEAFKTREKNDIQIVDSENVKDDLAALYIKIGQYADAQEILTESIATKEKRYGNKSRQLLAPLATQAEYYLLLGDYAAAEDYARKTYNLAKDIFGGESTKVVPSLKILSKVYTSIGDYARAEQILFNVIRIQKTKLGEDHVDVAIADADLALAKFYLGDPIPEVEELLSESEQVIGKKLGASTPIYADLLKNSAIVAIASADYSVAESYLEQAGTIWESKIGKRNNINAATIDLLMGDIRYNQYDYSEAESFYNKAKARFERFFGDQHPEYLKVQSKLSKAYYMQGDVKRAQRSLEEVLAKYQVFIEDYFPALSESEKAKFWNTIRTDYEFYNSIVVSHNRLNEDLIGSLYNNALLTKALLLSSSIKVRERILSSGNASLINLYEEWIKSKEQLTAALSMSTEEVASSGLNVNNLQNQVNDLEKELSLKSEDFAGAFESRIVTWNQVQNALQPNEVAVEMVRFRHFNHTLSDSIMYAVLYVNPDNKTKPQMVLLENGTDLERRNLKIYRNSIRYRVEDTQSYDAYWRKIQNEVGFSATIYLSPDGVYNQINLEAIPTGDGQYVLDNSNIVLVSNTKDIFLKRLQEDKVRESKIVAMFGNPTFYVTTEPGKKVDDDGLTRATNDVISQLPGTEAEVNEL